MIKTFFQITILVLGVYSTWGQTTKYPKNIEQAIHILDKDCSDSLKNIVKKTDDARLAEMVYPSGNQFKEISNWLHDDHSKINQYLAQKGIYNFRSAVILVTFKRYLLNHEIDEAAILRPFQQTELKWKEEDANRYTVDSLRGYYIPENLEDCIRELDSFFTDTVKADIKTWTEGEVNIQVRRGFGLSIIYFWQLWDGSRLSKYFNRLGVYEDDDMIAIIFNSYYRHLTGKEIDLNGQIKFLQDNREAMKKKQQEMKQEEYNGYKVGDTVIFKYNDGFVSAAQEEKHNKYDCIATGIIVNKNTDSFLIKVRVIEACDPKGILYIKSERLHDATTGQLVRRKRVNKKIKPGEEQWFYYNDWNLSE